MSCRYFGQEELQCHCGCGKDGMDAEFMKKLIALRKQLGFPLVVTSGYRCAKYNQQVSKTGYNGPHTIGRAVDIMVCGEQAYMLIKQALACGISGVGIQQMGNAAERFIHLDDLTKENGCPRPRVTISF